MATKRWILSLLSLAMTAVLAACGSGAPVQNQPPPPPSNLSIDFSTKPTSPLPLNQTTTVVAEVKNDSNNYGVDWSLTCSNSNCGTLSARHTDSGAQLTYTPPVSLPGNSETVSIVAFATADHAKNVPASIDVTAFGSSLSGTYVFQAQGADFSFNPYQIAGVIVLDGNGVIKNGKQSVNFFDNNPNVGALVSRSDDITGGSYFVGADGRGTITINTNDTDIGGNGVETFSLVFASNSVARIAQMDFGDAQTGVSATGSMDLQTGIAVPSAGYAFVASGFDIGNQLPTAMGGVFNIDSPNNISGKGSVADQNLGGTLTLRQALSGTISDPDPLGAVTLNLTVPGFPTTDFQFTGYIVDGTHITLIESDNTDGAGAGATAGLAIGQGSATGTFIDDTSFSGTYVFGVLGVDMLIGTPSTLTAAGLFTVDGSGVVASGFTDTFLQSNANQGTSGAQILASFIGTYSVDTRATGRVRATFNHFLPRPTPPYQARFFFYLTGNGNPALVLDGGDALGNYPSLGTGILYPQAASSLTLGGNYAFSFTQQNGGENDGTAAMTADPTAGILSGSADSTQITAGDTNPLDHGFIGNFSPPSSDGRFAGSISNSTGAPFFSANPTIPLDFYIIDQDHGFFVETDLVDPNSPSSQVSFGYYTRRQPVCDGCP